MFVGGYLSDDLSQPSGEPEVIIRLGSWGRVRNRLGLIRCRGPSTVEISRGCKYPIDSRCRRC